MIKIKEAISPVLSRYLTKYTTKDDRADIVSKVKGAGSSTLRDVMYRRNSVSEYNLPALKLLLLKASENAEAKIKEAKNCKKEIKKAIDSI